MIDTHRMLPQSWRGWTALALGVVVLATLPHFATPYYVGLLTSAMIAAMLALGVHLLVGATGLVTLGHGAFYGLAAYTVYLISPENMALPIWVTLPAAMATAGVAALIVGSLALRTRGFFFLMVTLAFGQMIFFVFHDTKLGGGTDGAYLVKPLIAAFGFELNPTSFPRARRAWPVYYVALVQLVAIYLVLAFLLRSMLGRVLEGIKVNEPRMRARLQHLSLQARRVRDCRHVRRHGRPHVELAHWFCESGARRLAEVCRGAAHHPTRWNRLALRRDRWRLRVLRPRRNLAACH